MCRRSSAARRSVLREALIDLRTRRQAGRTAAVNGHRSLGALKLHEAAPGSSEDLFRAYRTGPGGLPPAVVAARLEEYGPNEVAHERPPSWYVQLWHGFANAFSALLAILATVSLITGDDESAIIIGVMVLLSGLLRFFQERRASVAAQKLQEMVRVTCTVVRGTENGNATESEIPIRELVPGDLVKLSAGDMVPADVRLLSAKDLFVTQSTLTGESLPVEKTAAPVLGPSLNPLELPNAAFLGTNVVSGTATALVINTGQATYLGTIAESLLKRRTLTSFEQGIRGVSLLLLRFMAVMTVIVFVLNGITKNDWKEAFFFALAIAVGLTPEMLPMIVTGTLAIGAVSMSRKKVIVKRLNSIQNFGAMDVLCTDKTGTLTQDRIVLEKHCNVIREEDEGVLEYAYYNSHHQTGLKNLLDKAILAHTDLDVERACRKVDEIPFDFTRRRMSVIIDYEGDHVLICKGAVEEIFNVCDRYQVDEEIHPLIDMLKDDLMEEYQALSADGYRVLAVAYKEYQQTKEVFAAM